MEINSNEHYNMMNVDLYTIDWTAIGSIATAIAMIIAFRSISVSNKQN